MILLQNPHLGIHILLRSFGYSVGINLCVLTFIQVQCLICSYKLRENDYLWESYKISSIVLFPVHIYTTIQMSGVSWVFFNTFLNYLITKLIKSDYGRLFLPLNNTKKK